MERIRKREQVKRIESYHKDILQKGRLPPITDSDSDMKTLTMGSEQYQNSVRSMSRLSLDSTQRPDTARSPTESHDFFKMRRDRLAKALLTSSNRSVAGESSILKGNLKRDNFKRAMSSSAVNIPSELLPMAVLASRASGGTISSSQMSTKSMSTIGDKKTRMISMSRPLGSKAVAFGAVKKKKKKKRKSRR
jgi:hypothetical protein